MGLCCWRCVRLLPGKEKARSSWGEKRASVRRLLCGPWMREAGSLVVSDDGTTRPYVERESAEADCDALAPAYQLLNVHMHLLVVLDPRGIQGAGCV